MPTLPTTQNNQIKSGPTPNFKPLNLEYDTAVNLNQEQILYEKEERLRRILEEGKNYKKPSKLKYGFLFTVAGIIDAVDFLDITGVGIIISKIVSIAGTGIIYFTLWLTDSKVKRAQVYSNDALLAVAEFQQAVSQASRMAMRVSKTLSHIPGLKGLARKIPRGLVKLRKIARRNPLTKILIGGIINLMLFWIYLSYRDEKRTFKEARELASQIQEQFETA